MKESLNYFIIPGLNDVDPDNLTREKILQIIAAEKNVKIEQILTRSRNSELVESRFIYIKALRCAYNLNLVSIGREMGKDHTTIIHALQQFDNRYQFEEEFKKIANRIFLKLGLKLNK